MIILGNYDGVVVLRDDQLRGGTKSRYLDILLNPDASGYVYASPVYGGFQIALAAYCKGKGKEAAIFCAKRQTPHANSLRVKAVGGKVFQVKAGYLNVCQRRAKDYAAEHGFQYLPFGGEDDRVLNRIGDTMKKITTKLGREPDEIFLAVGSGVLLRGVLRGTTTAAITGIQVGKEFDKGILTEKEGERVRIIKYDRTFDKAARVEPPFPSSANYDAKAWEHCLKLNNSGNGKLVLFWNVL